MFAAEHVVAKAGVAPMIVNQEAINIICSATKGSLRPEFKESTLWRQSPRHEIAK